MYHIEPSATGKSYVVVDESGEVAVTRMDGKPRYFTSEHAAQTRADDMNAELATEVADTVSEKDPRDLTKADGYDTNNPAHFVARYGGRAASGEDANVWVLGESLDWANDEVAALIAEADSRCQAQPLHRMRAVPAVGYVEIDGKLVKACAQCIESANPKLDKLH